MAPEPFNRLTDRFIAQYGEEGERLLAEARERAERCIDRLCSEGCCTEWFDPVQGEVIGGIGPAGCPCGMDE